MLKNWSMWKRLAYNSSDHTKGQTPTHLYYSKEWLDTLCETYDFNFDVIYDESDRLICIVCPLSNAAGKRLISLPFSDYSPAILQNPDYFEKLMQFLQNEYKEYRIEFKTTLGKQEIDNLSIYREAVYHLVYLDSELQKKPSKNFLRGVKKAIKNKVEVRVTTDLSAIATFYELYKQLRFAKFNSIPQPILFFEKIWEQFINNGKGFVYEAVYKDKVIASMIILESGNKAYYKFGCSDHEGLHLKPNNLLFYQVIEDCKQRGLKSLDLGLSGVSDAYSGLRRWKRDLGGVSYPITYYRKEASTPSGYESQNQHLKETLGSLTHLIVNENLDTETTSKLSAILYPMFA